ncbi:hypothetical protein PV682_31935 [Streptomyces niveiscabiei]|uniref:hypothetical protein n=1 Tax=Streptomyces niveiscabiei TaxID=164115 RepID=UPI0029B253B4|nr:hypothetical protein [Streptomyces niveiscabiei]MDX3386034.1 hypothetical protein [Streptomyces niveiscabiei]
MTGGCGGGRAGQRSGCQPLWGQAGHRSGRRIITSTVVELVLAVLVALLGPIGLAQPALAEDNNPTFHADAVRRELHQTGSAHTDNRGDMARGVLMMTQFVAMGSAAFNMPEGLVRNENNWAAFSRRFN